MDYPRGKFGDCGFSRFDSIVRTNRQTYVDEYIHSRDFHY